MKELTFERTIPCNSEKVWETMLDPDGYHYWVKAFSPGSTMEGVWEEGATVRFVDPKMGGTEAVLDVFRKPESIIARHAGIIDEDGVLDTESEMARKWIGTSEEYRFESVGEHSTRLVIAMKCHEEFEDMFRRCWPGALERVEELCSKPR